MGSEKKPFPDLEQVSSHFSGGAPRIIKHAVL